MGEHRFHTPQPVELEVKVPTGDIEVTTVDGEESLVVVEGDERMVDQTLAVFELTGYKASDIAAYEAAYGLPNVPLQNVLVDGVSGDLVPRSEIW